MIYLSIATPRRTKPAIIPAPANILPPRVRKLLITPFEPAETLANIPTALVPFSVTKLIPSFHPLATSPIPSPKLLNMVFTDAMSDFIVPKILSTPTNETIAVPIAPNKGGNNPYVSTNFVPASIAFPRASITIKIPSLKKASPKARDISVNRVFTWFILASYESI